MESSTRTISPLTALRLSEERAAEAYRAAHRSMTALASTFAPLRQLAERSPSRVDYRAAANAAEARHTAAVERADLAYEVWQRAQHVVDAHWTATAGRTATARLLTYQAA